MITKSRDARRCLLPVFSLPARPHRSTHACPDCIHTCSSPRSFDRPFAQEPSTWWLGRVVLIGQVALTVVVAVAW